GAGLIRRDRRVREPHGRARIGPTGLHGVRFEVYPAPGENYKDVILSTVLPQGYPQARGRPPSAPDGRRGTREWHDTRQLRPPPYPQRVLPARRGFPDRRAVRQGRRVL